MYPQAADQFLKLIDIPIDLVRIPFNFSQHPKFERLISMDWNFHELVSSPSTPQARMSPCSDTLEVLSNIAATVS